MRKKIRSCFLILIFLLVMIFWGYVEDYSHVQEAAVLTAERGEIQGGNLYFHGEKEMGFMIYPGGKVDEKAYAVLAEKINDNGFTVVIVKMPFRLGIIDSKRGEKVMEANPQIDKWAIIGHSLGGTSASIYGAEPNQKLKGIVFLASYPYRDLSNSDLMILTINGTKDEVLDRKKAEEYRAYYPKESDFFDIQGGNHAQFGCYGKQQGDGEAEITWEEQHDITVKKIVSFFQ